MQPSPGHRRDAVVLGAAIGLVAVTFGVLASSAGLSVAKAMAMSLLVFTGASQFAATSGGSTPRSQPRSWHCSGLMSRVRRAGLPDWWGGGRDRGRAVHAGGGADPAGGVGDRAGDVVVEPVATRSE
jgi:hypothetical protein